MLSTTLSDCCFGDSAPQYETSRLMYTRPVRPANDLAVKATSFGDSEMKAGLAYLNIRMNSPRQEVAAATIHKPRVHTYFAVFGFPAPSSFDTLQATCQTLLRGSAV